MTPAELMIGPTHVNEIAKYGRCAIRSLITGLCRWRLHLQDIQNKRAISENERKSDGCQPCRNVSGTKEDRENAATALQYCPDDGWARHRRKVVESLSTEQRWLHRVSYQSSYWYRISASVGFLFSPVQDRYRAGQALERRQGAPEIGGARLTARLSGRATVILPAGQSAIRR